jgi:hypothetical protein
LRELIGSDGSAVCINTENIVTQGVFHFEWFVEEFGITAGGEENESGLSGASSDTDGGGTEDFGTGERF